MSVPTDLQYTKDHQWVRTEPGGQVSIGITDYGQQLLGDVFEATLPAAGTQLEVGADGIELSSVSGLSVSESPIAGAVVERSDEAYGSPDKINDRPYETWLLRVQPSSAVTGLLDAAAYQALIEAEA